MHEGFLGVPEATVPQLSHTVQWYVASKEHSFTRYFTSSFFPFPFSLFPFLLCLFSLLSPLAWRILSSCLHRLSLATTKHVVTLLCPLLRGG